MFSVVELNYGNHKTKHLMSDCIINESQLGAEDQMFLSRSTRII